MADQVNDRIDEFTAWGEFVKAWGWDVVVSGPGNDTTAPADQFEICVPANGDICKAGTRGGGAGQFNVAQGVAVDSTGHVYVADIENGRVQKFDSAGQFLLTFGGDVNKTQTEAAGPEFERNRCPVDPGDICQAGSAGVGDGQFSWIVEGSYITVGQDNTVYVGDVGRIQEFNPEGFYISDLPSPEGTLPTNTVEALTAFPGGSLAVGFWGKENVLVLNATTGAKLCEAKVKSPSAIASDSGGNLYVTDGKKGPGVAMLIRKFGSNCVEEPGYFFSDGFDESTGIATSSACDLASPDLFVGNSFETNSYVRAYGPTPDPEACPPPLRDPAISAQHSTAVGSDSATVRAKINPFFWGDASYYLQYGAEDCKASPSACEETKLFPGADLGAAVGFPLATAPVLIAGLTPNTTYFYRFVAKSGGSEGEPVFGEGEELCVADPSCGEGASFTTLSLAPTPKTKCSNQPFRGGPSAHLGDCRAYEMVSPLDKENGDIRALLDGQGLHRAALDQSDPDGEAITYSSYRPFAGPEGAPLNSQYLARRGSSGWSTQPLSPKQEGTAYLEAGDLDSHFKAFSPDLCDGWVLQDTEPTLTANALTDFSNLYRRSNCGPGAGGLEALTTSEHAPSGVTPLQFAPAIQGFSADGSHTIFRARGNPSGEGNEAVSQLNEYYDGGKLRLVCILPGEVPSGGECSAGNRGVGAEADYRYDSLWHAISEDGSRIYWSDDASKLYLRVNGAETLPVSAAAAHFWLGSADGSKAIFSEGGFENGAATLFEFDAATGTASPIAGEVSGVMGASEDASRVYLTSKEALSGEEENSEGAKAQAGKPNLYLYEAGEGGGSFEFVATLAAADVSQISATTLSPVHREPVNRTSRVTPDGLHVAFMATASLTGYGNTDANNEEADAEVFLFDAESGELVCASCNATGARPEGENIGTNAAPLWAAAHIPRWAYQLYDPRSLSDDGSRLFFESFEALVLRDTNGKQDVYEWQPGVSQKDCEENKGAELFVKESSGCIGLISSGESSSDSEFIDASADGRDAFFTTEESLLPQDPGLIDIYDARAGGGFPPPAPPTPSCEGGACQSPAAPPSDPTPASANFQGPGNLKPAKKKAKAKPKKKQQHKSKSQGKKKKKQQKRQGRAGR